MSAALGPSGIERRKTARKAVEYEVFVNYCSRTHVTRSRDISERGMGVLVKEPLASGEPVELTIMLPEATLTISLKGIVRYCAQGPAPSPTLPFRSGIEFTEEPGDAYSLLLRPEGISQSASHSLSIDVSAAECYRAIGDFAHYREWAKILEQVRVLETYPDGRAKRVEFVISLYIRSVRYVLDYAYDDPNFCLSFTSVGGDMRSVAGRYFFRPLGERAASATYEASVALDFPLPNRLVQYFSKIAMRKSMKDFKTYVEKIPAS